jgi:hypothetical protein
LKKEAKTFARLSPGSRRQPRKSFLVLFFKKEPLPALPLRDLAVFVHRPPTKTGTLHR